MPDIPLLEKSAPTLRAFFFLTSGHAFSKIPF